MAWILVCSSEGFEAILCVIFPWVKIQLIFGLFIILLQVTHELLYRNIA